MTIITEQDFFQGYPPEKVYITRDLHLYHKNIRLQRSAAEGKAFPL